jgi:putative peptidoglycan lipid II flippase
MRIAQAAFIIALGNVASRLLGVVRELVIAGLFGATGVTDAFVAASTVPTMVYDLLIGGAISAALIPVFSEYADDRPEDLGRVGSTVLNLAAIGFTVVVLLAVPFAPQLVTVLGVGFAPAVREQAIGLVRIILPAVVLLGLSGVTTALLYARRQFALPALVVAVYNLSIIVAALLFSGSLSTMSLVLGVLLGALLQILLQAFGLRGFRYSLILDLQHPGLRRIAKLYVPVAAGLVISQVGVLIDRNLASQVGEGSMAAMRFATTLVQFPLGLVATAVSFAVLPTLSRQADKGVQSPTEPQGAGAGTGATAYKTTLIQGLKMVLVLIVPASVGLAVLRVPLVQLLFQHGAFDAEATARTALAFLCYAPSIPFAAVDQVLIFAFYARKNTVTPVLVGIMGVGVYLAVALPLMPSLGMAGLVVANSAQWIAHALVLLVLLWRATGGLRGYGLGAATLKVAAASLAMGAVVFLAGPPVGLWLAEAGTLSLALQLGVLTLLGLGVFAALAVAIRMEEAGMVWTYVVARLKGRQGASEGT